MGNETQAGWSAARVVITRRQSRTPRQLDFYRSRVPRRDRRVLFQQRRSPPKQKQLTRRCLQIFAEATVTRLLYSSDATLILSGMSARGFCETRPRRTTLSKRYFFIYTGKAHFSTVRKGRRARGSFKWPTRRPF